MKNSYRLLAVGIAILTCQHVFAADEVSEAISKKAKEIMDADLLCKEATRTFAGKVDYQGIAISIPDALVTEDGPGCQQSKRDDLIKTIKSQTYNLSLSSNEHLFLMKKDPFEASLEAEIKNVCESLTIGKVDLKSVVTGKLDADNKKFTIHGTVLTVAGKEGAVIDVIATHEGTLETVKKDGKDIPQLKSDAKNEYEFIVTKEGKIPEDCTVKLVAKAAVDKPKPEDADKKAAEKAAADKAAADAAAAKAKKEEDAGSKPKANKGCSATGGDGGPTLLIFTMLMGLAGLRRKALVPVKVRR